MATHVKPLVLITGQQYSHCEHELYGQLISRLRTSFLVIFPDDIAQNPDIRKDIVGIVVVGMGVSVTDELLSTLPSVRIISSCGVGVDHIDLKYTKEKGIRVGNTRYVVSDSTADIAITLILVSTRKIVKGEIVIVLRVDNSKRGKNISP